MLMKIGVNVTDIEDRLYDILPIVESCVNVWGGRDSIITSADEKGKERLNRMRNVLIVELKRQENMPAVCEILEGKLGIDYNIVKDRGTIRIKWDRKQRELF